MTLLNFSGLCTTSRYPQGFISLAGCLAVLLFLISCMNEYNVAFKPSNPHGCSRPAPSPPHTVKCLLTLRDWRGLHRSQNSNRLNRYRMMDLKRCSHYLEMCRTNCVCCSFIEIFQIFKRFLENKCVICKTVYSLLFSPMF